jgi:hypothetical protein
MTIYMPEWGAASGSELQLRRLFNELGADAVLRRPLAEEVGQPDYFIEWGQRWLAIAVCRASYADIGHGQLFDAGGTPAFMHFVQGLAAEQPDLPKVVVMWSCNEQETRALAAEPGCAGVILLSRAALFDGGATALLDLLRPIGTGAAQLKRRYFPESEIIAIPVGRRQFHRDNAASLTGMFLDREQEWASKLDLDVAPEQEGLTRDHAVRLLNGVAGSGKTLIALQRAILLATHNPAQRVLFLIINAPVVADLMERIHRAGRVLPANLELCTCAAWLNRQWRKLYGALPVLPRAPGEVLGMVRALRQGTAPVRLSDQQLIEEIDYLNDNVIDTEAAYLAAERVGRGFSLRGGERRLVWQLYQQLGEELGKRRLRLWSAIPSDICKADKRCALLAYEHILVDEAQFLSPAALQVVKSSLKPGASLFLCADPRQGFLRNRLSWKSVGLEVAGRTKKLHRSYRTTGALLRSASALLARAVDDDPEDYLAPDFSAMEEGVPPVRIEVASPQDAVDRVANEIAALAKQANFPLSTILVLYGEGVSKALLYRSLCQGLGEQRVWWLNKTENRKKPPGAHGEEHLRLASLDSATGLEATFVFLLGTDRLLRLALGTPGAERGAEAPARKLYMAVTRSRYRFSLFTSEPFEPGYFDGIFEQRP